MTLEILNWLWCEGLEFLLSHIGPKFSEFEFQIRICSEKSILTFIFGRTWGSTQLVDNLFSFLQIIFKFHFLAILDSFWSTRSQMIDNAVLHHIMKKNLCFFLWKYRNYEQKWVLCPGFSEKYEYEANKFLLATQDSHFSMIFKWGLLPPHP